LTKYDSCSVFAENGGSITVTGDVTGGKECALNVENGGSVTVYGNVISEAMTAISCSGKGSIVEVRGDVTTDSGSGVVATGSAQVTINGTLTASDYIFLGDTLDSATTILKENGVFSTSKPGFYEYSDGNNFVFVTNDGSIVARAQGSGDPFDRGTVEMDIPIIVARIVAGIGMTLTTAQLAAVDMDHDGELTMIDVFLIMQKAAGYELALM
jgi:hypothetical protein